MSLKKFESVGKFLAATLFIWSLVLFSLRFFKYTDTDFRVFYAVGQHLIKGQPVYDLARDGEACFKYLPIYAILLAPLGMLPLALAKAAWAILQISSLIILVNWSLRQIPWYWVSISYLCFWGIFSTGVRDGQLSVLMTAGLLFFESNIFSATKIKTKHSNLFSLFLVTLLSPKLAHAFSWFALPKKLINVKSTIWVALQFIILNALALLVIARFQLKASIFRAFLETLQSSDHFAVYFLNQGIPAGLSRTFGLYSNYLNTLFFLALLPVVLILVFYLRKHLAPKPLFFCGLALVTVIHPLAWKHSYVLIFPLTTLCIKTALEFTGQANALKTQKNSSGSILAVLIFALFTIGPMTANGLGWIGKIAEGISARALATVVLVALLFLLQKKFQKHMAATNVGPNAEINS